MERIRRAAGRLLDRASEVARADVRYVARGTFWLSASQVISALSALGLSVVFARYMAQETFGTYKYALSLAGMFGALSLTGLSTAVSASAAHGQDGALAAGGRLALRWNAMAGAAVAICGAYYLAQGNGTLGWSLVTLGVTQPFVDAAGLAFSFLAGKRLFRVKAAFTLIHTAGYTAIVAAAILGGGGAVAAIVASVVGNLVGYAALNAYARRRYVNPAAPEDVALPGYAKHLSLMNVLGAVSGQIDKVLLFQFMGPTQVALWSFAQAPVSQVRQISKVLAGVILPKVSATPLRELRRTVARRAAGILAISLAALSAYWFLAPHFFQIFFPSYAGVVGVSRIYALSILATPLVIFKQSLIGHRQTRELYLVNGLQPAIKIAMVAASLPWGVAGVAVAAAAAEFVNLALSAGAFGVAARRDAAAHSGGA